jgi:hypothetical protein
MSVFNRRNAVAGWAVWKIGKRVVKRKLPLPRRRKQPPPPTFMQKLQSSPKAIAAFFVAAGAGLAAFLRLRRGGEE